MLGPAVRTDEIPPDFGENTGVSLDLGCGSNPRNPCRAARTIGIDAGDRPEPLPTEIEYVRAQVGFEPIPLPNDSVDVCTGYDFIEHVPRVAYMDGTLRFPFVELMGEIWRVLKPGGFLIALTPAFPTTGAFVDPTHVNFITRGTAQYFAATDHGSPAHSYGFDGGFKIVVNTWVPLASSLWASPEGGETRAVPWDSELRSMRRRFIWYEFWNLLGRPRADHLLWVLRKGR